MNLSLSLYEYACMRRGSMKNVKNVKNQRPTTLFTFFTFFTQSARVHVRECVDSFFTFFTFFTRPGCVHARGRAGARLASGGRRGSFLGCPCTGANRARDRASVWTSF